MNNELMEYIKIHIISLEQDLEMTTETDMYAYYEGAIDASQHILEYIDQLDKETPKE